MSEVGLHVTGRTTDFPWAAAVVAEVLAPGPFLFVHHKPSWPLPYAHERELQAVRCARHFEERLGGRNMPVILAGDFDAAPDSSSIRFWTGRQALDGMSVAYQDAWEAVHPPQPMDGGTTYYFVTDGIEPALAQARAAAGDGDVAIQGGATTINQYLAAGLIDELRLHIVPLTLGAARGCSRAARR